MFSLKKISRYQNSNFMSNQTVENMHCHRYSHLVHWVCYERLSQRVSWQCIKMHMLTEHCMPLWTEACIDGIHAELSDLNIVFSVTLVTIESLECILKAKRDHRRCCLNYERVLASSFLTDDILRCIAF